MKLEVRQESFVAKTPRLKVQEPSISVLTIVVQKEVTTTTRFVR